MSVLDLRTQPGPERRYIGTLTTASTADQRREALLELARHVRDEDHRAGQQDFSPVLDLWVPVTASHLCSEPLAAFNELVAAVDEFQSFCNNPMEYAIENDHATTDFAFEGLHERLQADIDRWADSLMGRRS